MSQRANAGFRVWRWPHFSVGAEDEEVVVPMTCLLNGLPSDRSNLLFIISGLPYSERLSRAVGVAHPLIPCT